MPQNHSIRGLGKKRRCVGVWRQLRSSVREAEPTGLDSPALAASVPDLVHAGLSVGPFGGSTTSIPWGSTMILAPGPITAWTRAPRRSPVRPFRLPDQARIDRNIRCHVVAEFWKPGFPFSFLVAFGDLLIGLCSQRGIRQRTNRYMPSQRFDREDRGPLE